MYQPNHFALLDYILLFGVEIHILLIINTGHDVLNFLEIEIVDYKDLHIVVSLSKLLNVLLLLLDKRVVYLIEEESE